MAARFIVGIDLGTTNTACAFVDTAAGRALRVFEVPQLVAPGETGARPTLPSFLYLAGAHELPAGSLDPPWATGRAWCVGLLAREQGGRVPARLVAVLAGGPRQGGQLGPAAAQHAGHRTATVSSRAGAQGRAQVT